NGTEVPGARGCGSVSRTASHDFGVRPRQIESCRAASRTKKAQHKLSRLVFGALQAQNHPSHRPKVGYGDNTPRAIWVPIAGHAGLETGGARRLDNGSVTRASVRRNTTPEYHDASGTRPHHAG